jgi:RHS repeat-associated protein
MRALGFVRMTAVLVAALVLAGLPAAPALGPSPVVFAAESADTTAVSGDATTTQPSSSSSDRLEEIEAWRSRTSRTWRLADGSFETELSTGSVHYPDGQGGWAPIDNRLVATASGWRNAANRYDATLPASAPGAVRVDAGGAWVSFALEDAADVAGSVSGATATYADVRAGVDLALTATADGLKEELVLADAAAASSFSFLVRAGGARPQLASDRSVRFVDAAGRQLFAFAAPFMVDAVDATSHRFDVALKPAGDAFRLTVTADPSWLDDPVRAWPVTVDPTVTLSPSQDCYLLTSDETQRCGTDALRVFADSAGTVRRSLLRFDVAAGLKDRARGGPVLVRTAELGLRKKDRTLNSTLPISVHRVTEAWDNNTTWTKRTATATWSTAGGSYAATPVLAASEGLEGTASQTGAAGWTYWYPTDLVQQWLDADHPDHGLLLAPAAGQTGDTAFHSAEATDATLRPTLRVFWEHALGNRAMYSYQDTQLGDRRTVRVNLGNGNLVVADTDLSIAGTAGHNLVAQRFYNNLSRHSHRFGDGWYATFGRNHELDVQLGGLQVTYRTVSGWAVTYLRNPDGSYTPTGRIDATLTRNADGTFTLEEHQSGVAHQFNAGGLLKRVEDRNGNTITYTYSGGQLVQVVDSQGRATNLTYTAAGLIETITGPAGRKYTYTYNANDQLTSVTDPSGAVTAFVYSATHEDLVEIREPEGRTTKLEYYLDADGLYNDRVKAITRVTDAVAGTGPTTSFAYHEDCTAADPANEARECTIVTDERGNNTTHYVDAQGRVDKAVDALGHARSSAYDANSNVLTLTGAGANATPTSLHYDTSNNVTQVTDPSGATSSLTYNDADNPYAADSYTAPQGTTVSYGYNLNGLLESITGGSAAETRYSIAYNSDGTIASTTAPNGAVTSYSYDAAGNRVGVDRPAPLGDLTLTVDAVSRVTSVTDGKGQSTKFGYDTLDRVTKITYHDGSTITYAYDALGNRTSTTESISGMVRTTEFVYDLRNHLDAEKRPDLTVHDYAYDAGGNLTSFTDPGGTVTYTYNPVNLVETVTEPSGAQTTFGYDENNNRTRTSYPNGVIQTANYDHANRLLSIGATDAAGNVLTNFAYDYISPATGQETTVRYSVTDNRTGATTTYGYDALTRLTSANNSGGDDYAYSYDINSNRTSISINGATTNATYNSADQLTDFGGDTFTYDANGNETARATGDGTTNFAYDVRNFTTQVAPPGASGIGYDYTGATQAQRLSAGGATFTNSPLGVASQTEALLHTYWTRDPAGQLISQRRGSTSHYYLFDALGSVVAVTDPTGAVTNRYTYSPYGRTTEERISGAIENPWRFAGEYHDESTGLYKIGARYYQPDLGRWTQTDPSGLEANPYLYVGANPISITDPTGFHGNYCTIVPDRAWSYDFSHACQAHDACYEAIRSGADVSRKACDVEFLDLMVVHCVTTYSGVTEVLCLDAAWAYYVGVRAAGFLFL